MEGLWTIESVGRVVFKDGTEWNPVMRELSVPLPYPEIEGVFLSFEVSRKSNDTIKNTVFRGKFNEYNRLARRNPGRIVGPEEVGL